MKWEPWEIYRPLDDDLRLPEPPCRECHFWNPRRKYLSGGFYDGVICCHAEEMQADFSCYKEKFEKSKSAESLCSSDPVIKAHSDLVQWISYCRDSLDNGVGSDKPGFEKYHYKIWHNLNILVMKVEQVMKGNLIGGKAYWEKEL